jgi:hypothetical protein
MYLSSRTVIQCSHGGRLVPKSRKFIRLGGEKILTWDSVMSGRIDDCLQCQKVTKIISGYESEAPNAPLLKNLEFLTDSTPPGRSVILEEPKSRSDSNTRVILLTSFIWLCVTLTAVFATYMIEEERLNRFQVDQDKKCQEDIKRLCSSKQ